MRNRTVERRRDSGSASPLVGPGPSLTFLGELVLGPWLVLRGRRITVSETPPRDDVMMEGAR